jgi:RNA recognition motif-containing protein
VEFEDADDASEAIFNRDGAELLGRTLRVSLAQPNQISKLMTSSSNRSASTSSSSSSQAVWKSEDWYQQYVASPADGTLDEQRTKQQDAETLR